MNKAVKIGTSFLFMALFVAAVVFFSMSYQTKDSEEETKKGEVSIKRPEKELYEIGEDVESGGIIFHVLEAEIIEDYKKLDSYYQKSKCLVNPEEYVESGNDFGTAFPEEIHFLHIKMSMTNNGGMKKSFSPVDFNVSSFSKNDAKAQDAPWRDFIAYDGQYTDEGDKDRKMTFSGRRINGSGGEGEIFIESDETITVDFVGEFSEYENAGYNPYDYDLYLSVYNEGNKIITNNPLGQKISLKLTREHEGDSGAGQEVLYDEIRDIQDLKSKNWTNSELAAREEYGYSLGEEEIPEATLRQGEAGVQYIRESDKQTVNNEVVEVYSQKSQITNIQITDWKNLPADFAEQGKLQKIAQRYQSVYGYQEDELKVLFLDISYSAEGTGKRYGNGEAKAFNFYENSYLYTKDDSGEYWIFGTADDWNVLSNSRNPENIGSVNMEWLASGNVVTVKMAYILPPDIYQEKGALYFSGGWQLWGELLNKDTPFAKIELK